MKKIISLIIASGLFLTASPHIINTSTFHSNSQSNSTTREIICSDLNEIYDAFNNLQAGDVIKIASGEYVGKVGTYKSEAITRLSGEGNARFFIPSAAGTADAPIIIEALNPLDPPVFMSAGTGQHNVFWVKNASYLTVRNISFSDAKKGIILDNVQNSRFENLDIGNIGEEGFHFRDGSSNNVAFNCYIHDTGKGQAQFGEGFYVGSDGGKWGEFNKECNNNAIINCTVGANVGAEHVDIKEGTSGTIIAGCTFDMTGIAGQNYADSSIDIKGDNVIITHNNFFQKENSIIVAAIQTHITSYDNSLCRGNIIAQNNFQQSGSVYAIDVTHDTGVSIYDNTIDGGELYRVVGANVTFEELTQNPLSNFDIKKYYPLDIENPSISDKISISRGVVEVDENHQLVVKIDDIVLEADVDCVIESIVVSENKVDGILFSGIGKYEGTLGVTVSNK